MTDTLFPPSLAERLAALASFIGEEIGHREHMAWRHPEKSDYWQRRVDQAKRALEHVEKLAEAVR